MKAAGAAVLPDFGLWYICIQVETGRIGKSSFVLHLRQQTAISEIFEAVALWRECLSVSTKLHNIQQNILQQGIICYFSDFYLETA